SASTPEQPGGSTSTLAACNACRTAGGPATVAASSNATTGDPITAPFFRAARAPPSPRASPRRGTLHLGEIEALDARLVDAEPLSPVLRTERHGPTVHRHTPDARVARILLDAHDNTRVAVDAAGRVAVGTELDDQHAVAEADRRRRAVGGAVGATQTDHRRVLGGEKRGDLVSRHRDPLARHQIARTSSGATRTTTRFPAATRDWTRRATPVPVPAGRGASGVHGMTAPA